MADTATQTALPTFVNDLLPPAIPSGAEVYDLIMGQIEPELTSEGIATLDAKYTNETAAEAKARVDRYNKAFEEYDKRFANYVTLLKEQVHSYKRISVGRAEERANREDQKELLGLEANFTSAA